MTAMVRALCLLLLAGAVPALARPPLPPTLAHDDVGRTMAIVARAASRSGQWQAAARLWRAITVATPTDAAAWAGLGAALVRLDAPGDAIAALGRAENLAPDQAGVALDRGRAELALGHGPEAAAAFDSATRANPGDPRGWTGLGIAHDLLGAHASAASAYDRALAIDPLNVAARHNRQVSASMALAASPIPERATPSPGVLP